MTHACNSFAWPAAKVEGGGEGTPLRNVPTLVFISLSNASIATANCVIELLYKRAI